MKKIISLFVRNYESDRLVRDEIVPGAEWVIAGEGVATRKFDGTCCMIKDGQLYKRYDVKKGRQVPENFMPAQDKDQVTGHWPGWLPVGDGPEDKWHRQAFSNTLPDGTYELCGPKVQGNLENFPKHVLIPHGQDIIEDCPRTFAELKTWILRQDIEGIVWHHQNGKMVKIKRKDFGYLWPQDGAKMIL